MMICERCKSKIEEGFYYCPVCKYKLKNNARNATKFAGTVYGNIGNASTAYGEAKFHANRGHGFAAERANHLYDMLYGKNVHIIGDDNTKNGADRIVNDISIQSKYCSTGAKCIKECFVKDTFRYMNADGTPMQIEVPSDLYDDAIKAMMERIRRKQIPGVDNPEEAKNIVRKGNFTYEQAKNISRFGTVESLAYDAVNGIIIGKSVFCISAIITFAVSVWSGRNFEEALKDSIISGIKTGGVAFLTAVLSGQLTKAGIHSVVSGASSEIVKAIGPKTAATLVNAFRSGKNIYGGAAMNSAEKMISSNIVTAAASVVVLSSVDIIETFRGRISVKQFVKNIINTTGSVASGTGGFVLGSAEGAKVGAFIGTYTIPGVGTVGGAAAGSVIGGIIGACGGGLIGGKATSWGTDKMIEDDATQLINILECEFINLAISYVLNKKETEKAVELLAKEITSSILKDMYQSKDRVGFAKKIVGRSIELVVKKRRYIKLPTNKQIMMCLQTIFD